MILNGFQFNVVINGLCSTHGACFIGQYGIVVCTQIFGKLSEIGDFYIRTDVYFHLVGCAMFGSHQYDTIRTAYTVYGSCGSVLQYGETFDVGRVDTI